MSLICRGRFDLRCGANRNRATFDPDRSVRRAAYPAIKFPVRRHIFSRPEPFKNLLKNYSFPRVIRPCDAVMDPLSVTPRIDQSGVPQIREMTRNLRLTFAQNIRKKTNAYFTVAH